MFVCVNSGFDWRHDYCDDVLFIVADFIDCMTSNIGKNSSKVSYIKHSVIY